MGVVRGQITTRQDLQIMADLANAKHVAGYPFVFIPEWYVAGSEEEMLKLYDVDRATGETTAAVAIRSDTLSVFRFTGGDFRDINSWEAGSDIIIVIKGTGAALPAAGAGKFLFRFNPDGIDPNSGLPYDTAPIVYQGIGAQWVEIPLGQWRNELGRIRAGILNPQPIEFGNQFHDENGEHYGPFASFAPSYSQRKYSIAATRLDMPKWSIPGAVGFGISFIQFDEVEFLSTAAATLTYTAAGLFTNYLRDDFPGPQGDVNIGVPETSPTVRFIVKIIAPFPMTVTIPEINLRTVFYSGAGLPNTTPPNLRIVSQQGIQITLRTAPIAGGGFQMFFSGAAGMAAGTTIMDWTLQVDSPWYFEGSNSLIPVNLTGNAGGGSTEAKAVHSSAAVNSKQVFAAGNVARILSKIRRTYVAGGQQVAVFFSSRVPTDADWWYEKTTHSIASDVGGFFRTKLAAAKDPAVLIRDGQGHLALAPHAEEAIQNKDGTVRIGAFGDSDIPVGAANPGAIRPPFPRSIFFRDLDSPNKAVLNSIPAGSFIPQITLRRMAAPNAAGKDWQPTSGRPATVTVKIGCIRNNAFHQFDQVDLATEYTYWPDYVLYEPYSLSYQCDEEIDIQAAVAGVIVPNADRNQHWEGCFGGPNSGAWIVAEFYNCTMEVLQTLPNP